MDFFGLGPELSSHIANYALKSNDKCFLVYYIENFISLIQLQILANVPSFGLHICWIAVLYERSKIKMAFQIRLSRSSLSLSRFCTFI